MAEKSILEQALLQVNTLEEAVKQNAKGILSSVMKKELNELLKESEEQEDEALKSQEDEASMEDEAKAEDDEAKAEDDEMSTDDEESAEDDEDSSDEEETNDMATDFGGDDEEDLDNEPGKGIDSLDADGDMGDDEDVTDMTSASDDEVMKVFKAMRPEDGIVVKKDGNTVSFHDGDDEYIIKLDDIDSAESEEEENFGHEVSPEGEEDEDESATLYEIELNESDDEEEEGEKEEATEGALKGLSNPKKVEAKEGALKGLSNPKKVEAKETALKGLSNPKKVEAKETALKGLSNPKKVQADEAARTKSNPHGNKNGMDRAGLPSKKTYKAGSGINEEFETLKKQNDEYKKALVLFKDKLNEVAIFNANLAYFTRLVTENSTTKQEKLNILKRFDSVSTMNESKNLFTSIKAELETKKPVNESVANKISSTPSTSTSTETEMLSESKAYENPQFSRMKDLMKKLK